MDAVAKKQSGLSQAAAAQGQRPGGLVCQTGGDTGSGSGHESQRTLDRTASTSVCTAFERALVGRLVGTAPHPPLPAAMPPDAPRCCCTAAAASCRGDSDVGPAPALPLVLLTLNAVLQLLSPLLLKTPPPPARVPPAPGPLPLPNGCSCSWGAPERQGSMPPAIASVAVGLLGLLQSPPCARCDRWSPARAGTRLYERRRRKLPFGVPSPGIEGSGEPHPGAADGDDDDASGSSGMPAVLVDSLRVRCIGWGRDMPPALLSALQLCGVLAVLLPPPLPVLPGGRGRRLREAAAAEQAPRPSAAKRLAMGWCGDSRDAYGGGIERDEDMTSDN